jgi:hypothetical protein
MPRAAIQQTTKHSNLLLLIRRILALYARQLIHTDGRCKKKKITKKIRSIRNEIFFIKKEIKSWYHPTKVTSTDLSLN